MGTPNRIRELDEREVLRFALGEDGAHQILNRTQETVTFLAVSSHVRPDIMVYSDSNKLGVGQRFPRGGGRARLLYRELAVDYRDREQPPGS